MRKNLGLTQEELARRLNVRALTISRWERDSVGPSELAMRALAGLFVLGHNGIRSTLPASVYTEFKRLASRAGNRKGQRLDSASSCSDCKTVASCFDHRDYLRPEVAEPVCHSCNAKRGVAIRTLLDHLDYWRAFDWTEKPLQPLALSRQEQLNATRSTTRTD